MNPKSGFSVVKFNPLKLNSKLKHIDKFSITKENSDLCYENPSKEKKK